MAWNYLNGQLAGSTLRQSQIYVWFHGTIVYFLSLLESLITEFEIYIVYSLLGFDVKTIIKSHNHKVKEHIKWSRSLITFSIWISVKCAWMYILNFLFPNLCLWEVDGVPYVGHSFITSVFV